MAYEGSCLCAAAPYQLNSDFESASHCTMCQKQHGAARGSYGTLNTRYQKPVTRSIFTDMHVKW